MKGSVIQSEAQRFGRMEGRNMEGFFLFSERGLTEDAAWSKIIHIYIHNQLFALFRLFAQRVIKRALFSQNLLSAGVSAFFFNCL